jgi:hypothetical protein
MKRVCATVLLSAVVAVVSTGAARADRSFGDPAGDQQNTPTAPGLDITTVDVSNAADGLVTFRVTIANYQSLPPGGVVAAVLDTDRNINTGERGLEASIILLKGLDGAERVVFEQYSPAAGALVEAPATNMSATFSAGVWTWTIPRSELSDTRGFAFGLIAAIVNASGSLGGVDIAPDGNELWVYELAGLPPAKLFASTPAGKPAKPVAGKPFTTSVLVTLADKITLVTSATVTCRVHVGSATIHATGRFHKPTTASCAMNVPPGAKGKTLRGTMTIHAMGGTIKKSFHFPVA